MIWYFVEIVLRGLHEVTTPYSHRFELIFPAFSWIYSFRMFETYNKSRAGFGIPTKSRKGCASYIVWSLFLYTYGKNKFWKIRLPMEKQHGLFSETVEVKYELSNQTLHWKKQVHMWYLYRVGKSIKAKIFLFNNNDNIHGIL